MCVRHAHCLGLTGIVSLREVAANGVSCHPHPRPWVCFFPIVTRAKFGVGFGDVFLGWN